MDFNEGFGESDESNLCMHKLHSPLNNPMFCILLDACMQNKTRPAYTGDAILNRQF